MTIHVTPIPSTIELVAPAFTLGDSNVAGDTGTAVASNSTLGVLAAPSLTLGDSNVAGDAATAVASNSTLGVVATQAEMEAGTSTAVAASPGRTKYHPGVAKAWCRIAQNGTIVGSTSYPNSYNIASTSTSSTGDYLVTWDVDFSQTVYVVETTCADAGPNNSAVGSFAVGSTQIITVVTNTATQTILSNCVVAYGDQ